MQQGRGGGAYCGGGAMQQGPCGAYCGGGAYWGAGGGVNWIRL